MDARNKIEIDLLQENRNKSIKAIAAIKRTVLLTGLAMIQEMKIKIGKNFDVQIQRETHSSSHRGTTGTDKGIVLAKALYQCAQQNS